MKNISLAVLITLLIPSTAVGEVLGVYFSPDQKSYLPIVNLYDKAQSYIHLAIYSLTKDEFAQALIAAHQRGVEVKVIMDRRQAGNRSADDEKLEKAGIPVLRNSGVAFMHNKFCVIDGRYLYTGSYNHTDNATLRNDENYIIIDDPPAALLYEEEFQKLWDKYR